MNLTYNSLDLSTLGEVTVKWSRDFEGGEAPQRCRVTLHVGLKLFERSYADNYALIRQAQAALSVPGQQLTWTNPESGETYIDQTATLTSANFPEEWGTYFQQLELSFTYYEALDTSGQNLTGTFIKTGSTATLALGHFLKWKESATTQRFNRFRAHREETRATLTAEGLFLGDTTLPLADRRAALAAQAAAFRRELNGADGRLAYGGMFNEVVKIESFECDFDQMISAVPWKFTASYVLFPDPAQYATVDATAEERDGMTGETFLNLHGKIQAATEAQARAKLDEVMAAVAETYGYDTGQLLERATTPNLISANADGDTFTELTFTVQWRQWRASNQRATFTATGNSTAISLGEVRTWEDGYKAERFDAQRSERRRATGAISAAGTWKCDAALPLAQRRAMLLRQQRALKAEVNAADGTLTYGDWSQVLRVDDLQARINQAETGIDWTFSASYSLFPNEGGYATCEFTADQRDDVESGDQFLSFAGEIAAPNGALARAKLASLRTATLGIYGFTLAQRVRGGSTTRDIFANGDATAGIPEGLETEGDVAGVSFLRLSFTEEYRRRAPGTIVSSKWSVQTRTDTASGLVSTVYAGTVTASGSNADTALAAAGARALALGANKEASLDETAFLKGSTWVVERRQLTTGTAVELVSLAFTYEYQSKGTAGLAYGEVSTALARDSFGPDSESVSGSITARDEATAQAFYQAQVRNAYSGRLIRSESTTSHRLLAGATAAPRLQWLKLDFAFSAHSPKPPGRLTARYALSVSRDLLQLRRTSHVRGSVYAADRAAADALADTLFGALGLGSLTHSDRTEDHDYTPEADAFLKLDLADTYEAALTGVEGILECHLTEVVRYSGTRWVVQPLPHDSNGAGGISIVQPAGHLEGMRTLRGSVTAGELATAEAWVWAQQALLTGDTDGTSAPLPPEVERGFEFVPRTDGIARGEGANVRLHRLSFTFAEILPHYPAPV